MPLFYADLVPGSGTYLYQETLYRSESCKRRLKRTAPCGPPGMATQAGRGRVAVYKERKKGLMKDFCSESYDIGPNKQTPLVLGRNDFETN